MLTPGVSIRSPDRTDEAGGERGMETGRFIRVRVETSQKALQS
jgi:hypothetical protein